MESWREGELKKNTRRLPDFYLWQHCGAIHGNEEPKRSGRWRKKNKFTATGAPSGGRELRKSRRKTQLSGHSPGKMRNRWNWRVRLPVVKFSQSETESYTVHLQFYIFKSQTASIWNLKSYSASWTFAPNLPQPSWVFSFTKQTLWCVPESDSSYSRGHSCKCLQGSDNVKSLMFKSKQLIWQNI